MHSKSAKCTTISLKSRELDEKHFFLKLLPLVLVLFTEMSWARLKRVTRKEAK